VCEHNRPDWKERIKGAADGRTPAVTRAPIEPYQVRLHRSPQAGSRAYAIEMRPRAGTWSPFFAACPAAEKEILKPNIMHSPSNRVPSGGALFNTGECLSDDGQWWILFAQNEATPTQSYFLFVDQIPSQFIFGVHNGQPQYLVRGLE
jgi:hypothetical protein